ncbi:uroporphyrinogen-III C-methyltransferase [Microcoleus sp. FACHB-1515]|uniref:uroporphyrinogen-III C-methyltransferase n=1 Tax=Cyanophyceae TaxID=3028117 RepID=UPI0016873C83|nr:uroporphyrinogen-III C-methyltransferase [Microcoleus sp. FACHB-1515]MBD2089768.1 uroporphyrinogen-III C-methyltransferase [Microcoleus sp. FACHB-1515]
MGFVALVGSGPGHPHYLTVRAQQLLAQAEVLIYDALVDSALLALVPPNCLKLDVGKRGGQPSASQAEINRLLVEHGRDRQVVRLKSGDPFIFGRASAEIEALQQAGCRFEVVPGISSALAAPLLASIPLTDPVLSRCFAVLSAHDLDAIDWSALARLDTIVILMGAKHLGDITDRLQAQGRSSETPVAIVQWASQPQQQIWTGTLGAIARTTAGQSLSPAVIIIGEVVNLRPYLMPAPRPLSGKTILVTRAASQSSQFTTLLEAQGATVIEMPAIEIQPPSSWEPLDRALADLSRFDWLILTSTNGVDYFFDRLFQSGQDVRALAGLKIAVVGQKTAASLQQRGLQPDFIPPDFVADSLIAHFPDPLTELKVLFPRVESGGREVLMQEFSAAGAIVTEVPAYQSACPRSIDPAVADALMSGQIDIVTFASSKTVKCFAKLVDWANLPKLPIVASIGPQTSADCQRCLGRVDVEATTYTLAGLTEAIAQQIDIDSVRQDERSF